MPAAYVLHRPAAPLAAHVESIWFAAREALPHGRERNLPTGRADIVIPLRQESIVRFDALGLGPAQHLRGAVVSGAHDRVTVRATDEASVVMGVHFRAGGAAAFFGPALAELHNRTVLLDVLWGVSARDLRERLQAVPDLATRFRLVEAALLARLSARPTASAPDPAVAFALAAFARDPSAARVDAVQRATGSSPQQFVRRFGAAVGLTPKRYARVLRFNALLPGLVRVGLRDWAQVAAESGYFDQSHLIHEFRRLAGITPSAYASVSVDQPTHVAVPAGGKISKTSAAPAASLRAVHDQEPP